MTDKAPLPEPIGEIVGVRLTPEGPREFWGYFAKGFESLKKVQVHTADQMHAYAAADNAALRTAYEQERKACHDLTEKVIPNLRERIKALEDALLKIIVQNECDMLLTGDELRAARAALEATK